MSYQLRYPNNLDIYAGQLTLNGTDQNGTLIAPIVTTSNVLCANLYAARAATADNFSGNITGDSTLTGFLNVSANVDVGTDLTVGGHIYSTDFIETAANATVGTDLAVLGNVTVGNDLTVDGSLNFTDLTLSGNASAYQYTSTATTLPPFVVASSARVTNLNAATSGTADIALSLKSATTTIDVASATAPSSGQVLTATSSTTATWQTPSTPSGDLSISDLTLSGNVEGSGWISTTSNISSSSLSTVDASLSGNIQVQGWGAFTANVSSQSLSVTGQLTSTVTTGTAPLVVSSTTRVSNLNVATCGTSDTTNALQSATTTIDVSSATAPSSGQVLTATGDSAATWQTPSGGGSAPLGSSITIDPLDGSVTTLLTSSNWFQAPLGRVLYCPTGGTPGQSFMILNRRLTNVQAQDVYAFDGTLLFSVPGGESFMLICLTSGGSAGSWTISKIFNPP